MNASMSAAPAEAPPISVVTAVVVSDPRSLVTTLEAVRRQVYEPDKVVVVGGDKEGRRVADESGVGWLSNIPGMLAALDAATSHVWIVRSGAEPRPDALRALVDESERVEAGIAGSKLLAQEDPERLVSVGVATDVFDTPYTGLDEGEIDAGQYDVLRDVAAVGGASMLVRRDLARGLRGPDPRMAPGAAAIDLCQRARLRGGRVVVVPSSEVLVPDSETPAWREEAGQIRSMVKVYSLMTLAWALPLRFLIGLVQAIVAPFLGRWTFGRWVRSWAWNVLHLPSTLVGRRSARHNRAVGDTELFRFQLRGSADMRRIVGETGERLRERLPGDDQLSLAELGAELRQPAFVVGGLALMFVLVSVRRLFEGFPAVGYSLPLPESGLRLLDAYAGGWNPAGFGSVEPLPPFLGLAGLVQTVAFGSSDLGAWVLIAAAFLSGVWGMTRLLRTWNIEVVPGVMAGLVLMAGPATRGIAAETGLGTLVALGVLPWALRVPLARWPQTWRARIGRVAGAAWVTGLLAMASPILLPVPVAALVGLAVITPREPGPWRAAGVSLVGSLVAFGMLLPWIGSADLLGYLAVGEAYWEPGLILAAAFGAALVFTVLTAPRRLSQIAGWGGVIAAAGTLIARLGDYGPGRDAQLGGMAIAALGSALVIGVTFEVIRQVGLVRGWRRFLAGIAFLGAAAVTVSVVLVLLPGRAGLPSDDLAAQTGFTGAADTDPGSSRVLLFGPEDELPGESRDVLGAPYRVVSAPVPALWEAWLPEPRSADVALENVLESLIAGESFRAGADLAPFGIRWVIFVGESPFEAVLDGQLDLVPLQGSSATAFVSEATPNVRAVTDGGIPWSWDSNVYSGGSDQAARVFVAESANSRWGDDWAQERWGNSVAADTGEVRFEPIVARRTQAMVAAGLGIVLLLASWWGRRRR
jgi:GT2 family glycosyltransferase